eukprot:jgi/Mesvir1/14692/Mv05351-RA.1
MVRPGSAKSRSIAPAVALLIGLSVSWYLYSSLSAQRHRCSLFAEKLKEQAAQHDHLAAQHERAKGATTEKERRLEARIHELEAELATAKDKWMSGLKTLEECQVKASKESAERLGISQTLKKVRQDLDMANEEKQKLERDREEMLNAVQTLKGARDLYQNEAKGDEAIQICKQEVKTAKLELDNCLALKESVEASAEEAKRGLIEIIRRQRGSSGESADESWEGEEEGGKEGEATEGEGGAGDGVGEGGGDGGENDVVDFLEESDAAHRGEGEDAVDLDSADVDDTQGEPAEEEERGGLEEEEEAIGAKRGDLGSLETSSGVGTGDNDNNNDNDNDEDATGTPGGGDADGDAEEGEASIKEEDVGVVGGGEDGGGGDGGADASVDATADDSASDGAGDGANDEVNDGASGDGAGDGARDGEDQGADASSSDADGEQGQGGDLELNEVTAEGEQGELQVTGE